MGRTARIIDPKRIHSLKKKINDRNYVDKAVSGLAEVLTHILCEDKNISNGIAHKKKE